MDTSNEPLLRPATPDEIEQSLVFALRFDGRKRIHTGDEFMAKITAERLIQHLERSGFVVMKRPALKGSTTPGTSDRDR